MRHVKLRATRTVAVTEAGTRTALSTAPNSQSFRSGVTNALCFPGGCPSGEVDGVVVELSRASPRAVDAFSGARGSLAVAVGGAPRLWGAILLILNGPGEASSAYARVVLAAGSRRREPAARESRHWRATKSVIGRASWSWRWHASRARVPVRGAAAASMRSGRGAALRQLFC